MKKIKVVLSLLLFLSMLLQIGCTQFGNENETLESTDQLSAENGETADTSEQTDKGLNDNEEKTEGSEEIETTEESDPIFIYEPENPGQVDISFSGLDELEEWRIKAEEEGLTEISEYMALYDSLPKLSGIVGEVSLLRCAGGRDNCTADDPVAKRAELFYIKIEGEYGDWCQLTYVIEPSPINVVTSTIYYRSDDGRIIVYNESEYPYSKDEGYILTWTLTVDGFPMKIVYYTKDQYSVTTDSFFDRLSVTEEIEASPSSTIP